MEKKTGTLEKLVIKCALAGVGFLIYKFGVFMHDNIFRRGYPSLLMIPIILNCTIFSKKLKEIKKSQLQILKKSFAIGSLFL